MNRVRLTQNVRDDGKNRCVLRRLKVGKKNSINNQITYPFLVSNEFIDF